MTHYYEKNIVEIKNEYTTFLCNILTPLLYEGLKSMYDHAIKTSMELKKTSENTIGVLQLFQLYLRNVPNLTKVQIEKETKRIKNCCRDREFLEDLIKAVVKSNIVLLTFNASNRKSEIVNQKYHERIYIEEFIHKCLIECARILYTVPELFWHKYDKIEINRNTREVLNIINKAIKEAIRRMLPMRLILMDYLKNDYIQDINQMKKDSREKYNDIKNMVNNDLNGKHNQIGGDGSSDEEDYYGSNAEYENKYEDEEDSNNVQNFILGNNNVNNNINNDTNSTNQTDNRSNADKKDSISMTSDYEASIQEKLIKVKNELSQNDKNLEEQKEIIHEIAKVNDNNNNNINNSANNNENNSENNNNDNINDIFVRKDEVKPTEKSEYFANYIK